MPEMPQAWQEQNQANKARWFLGNADAVAFTNMLFDAVELWDDMIDKDVTVTDEHVNRAFLSLMFGLPANEWFARNRAYYLPLIMCAVNAFHDANDLAKSGDRKLRNLAFHLRNIGVEIHIATAFLVGGYEHMRGVSREIREFFAFESFDEWDKSWTQ